MKRLLKPLTLAACLLGGLHLAADERPNIIFIITDDMYPWQMDFMPEGDGKNFTPQLDRLAEEGTLMRGQHTSSSVCTPSRYSALTGRYASRSQAPAFLKRLQNLGQTHVEWNSFINPAEEKSIAHYLDEAGYRTGFVGKDHAAYDPGHKQLSITADMTLPENRLQLIQNYLSAQEAIRKLGFEYAESIYFNNPDWIGSYGLAVHNQDWITQGALNFLNEPDDRPFFLYFATTIPHGPTEADRAWKADRRATPMGWLAEAPEVQPDAESIEQRARMNGAEGRETLLWIDDAIGALVDTLVQNGQIDNTIIFFFNDHGQSAKGSIYQGGVHDPSFVWRQGGWPIGHQTEALVSNIDFTPTILELAGAEIPDNIDGVSFAPILRGDSKQVHEALFFEMGYTRGVLKDGFKYIALRYPPKIANLSLEERQANLTKMNDNLRDRGRPVHTEDPTMPFSHLMPIPGGHDAEQAAIRKYPNYYDADQLYDLSKDPKERNNLADDPAYAEKLAELQALLREHLQTLPGNFDL